MTSHNISVTTASVARVVPDSYRRNFGDDAIIYTTPDGTLHREDGPAVFRPSDGFYLWYNYGKLHREDGPAARYSSGELRWFLNGGLHRDNGPAVILPDGTRLWYDTDDLHREDGPAIIYSADHIRWVLRNTILRFDDWCDALGKTDAERTELLLIYGSGSKR